MVAKNRFGKVGSATDIRHVQPIFQKLVKYADKHSAVEAAKQFSEALSVGHGRTFNQAVAYVQFLQSCVRNGRFFCTGEQTGQLGRVFGRTLDERVKCLVGVMDIGDGEN